MGDQLKKVGVIADLTSKAAGSPLVVSASLCSLLLCLAIGPFFHFSTEYQLISNSVMSAVSYLMLFVLQHTQNREGKVLQLKLDTILRALPKSDQRVIRSEGFSHEELEALIQKVLNKDLD